MQVKSVIADFNGRNQDFRKYINYPKTRQASKQDFKAILATAVKDGEPKCKSVGTL